jgi:hypothetical protein
MLKEESSLVLILAQLLMESTSNHQAQSNSLRQLEVPFFAARQLLLAIGAMSDRHNYLWLAELSKDGGVILPHQCLECSDLILDFNERLNLGEAHYSP